MHLDQLFYLAVKLDVLETGRRLIKGTPQELAARGLISLAKHDSLDGTRRKDRQKRRHERRVALVKSKESQ
jgi:hypothetical protein